MARYWENSGNPLPDGRLCFVVDPEDGTHAIKTYGKTKEEVLDKMAKSFEHGQRLITKQRSVQRSTNSPVIPTASVPSQKRTKLTPDETLTAVAELANPAKAPEAVVRLVESATGVDLRAQAKRDAEIKAGQLAERWGANHPELEDCSRAEKRLLIMTAMQIAGGIENITDASLDSAFQSMLNQGYFSGEPGEYVEPEPHPQPSNQIPTSATPGNGNPRTTVRPRIASSIRSSSLRATPPAATPRNKPMFTRAQVDAMSGDELAEKMKTIDGFAQLIDEYAKTARRVPA